MNMNDMYDSKTSEMKYKVLLATKNFLPTIGESFLYRKFMKAIILAAGKGTRLEPITLETPKAMVEVYGKPLLAHNMDKLLPYVDEFIIVIKYKQEKIREYFGCEYRWVPIRYHEQGEKTGTGGALIRIDIQWDCFILASDTIYHQKDIDALALSEGYWVLAQKVKNPEKYGIFSVDQENILKQVVEKPQEYIGNLASLFYFKVNSELVSLCENILASPRWEYELTDALNMFAEKKEVKVWEISYKFIDITSVEDLETANTFIKPSLWNTQYIENIWEYEVHLGIPQSWIQEIVDYTLDQSDTALREGTGDWKKRFISVDNLSAWYKDEGRYPFTLLDTHGSVVWLWWGRPAKLPYISEIQNQDMYSLMQENEDNMHTSGIRIYPSARGKWLASKFMEVCGRCYFLIFPEYCMSDDVGEDNIASQKSFEKLWFQKVGIWKNINNSPESGKTRYVYIKKYYS